MPRYHVGFVERTSSCDIVDVGWSRSTVSALLDEVITVEPGPAPTMSTALPTASVTAPSSKVPAGSVMVSLPEPLPAAAVSPAPRLATGVPPGHVAT
jgi:hypothetical protein